MRKASEWELRAARILIRCGVECLGCVVEYDTTRHEESGLELQVEVVNRFKSWVVHCSLAGLR